MILELILAAGSLSVHFPATAEVVGTEITLGEIAQISGDEELVASASELSLGYTPAPGFSRLLDATRMQIRLAELLPGASLSISGESRCRVVPRVEEIEAARLVELARGELLSLFKGLDVEIAQQGSLGNLRVPQGNVAASLAPVLQRRDQRPGIWSVPVQVIVDDTVYQTVWTRWKIGIWSTQQVLTRAVPRGQTVQASDFRLERVQLTGATHRPVMDLTHISGAVARYDLAVGSAIALKDLERPRVVKKGDLVTLEIRSGMITARIPVYLLEGGRISDVVRVSPVDRQREMTAVIRSKDLVVIKLK